MDKQDAKLRNVAVDCSGEKIIVRINVAGRDETVTVPQTMEASFWFWAKELTLDELAKRACEELMQRDSRRAREAEIALKRMRGEPY